MVQLLASLTTDLSPGRATRVSGADGGGGDDAWACAANRDSSQPPLATLDEHAHDWGRGEANDDQKWGCRRRRCRG